MTEPKITGYKYSVISKKTLLLIGEDLDSIEKIEGWNINLIKYELWSDGDIVICECTTITGTTEEHAVKYLKRVVKDTAVFTLAYELGISHFAAYDMFIERDDE